MDETTPEQDFFDSFEKLLNENKTSNIKTNPEEIWKQYKNGDDQIEIKISIMDVDYRFILYNFTATPERFRRFSMEIINIQNDIQEIGSYCVENGKTWDRKAFNGDKINILVCFVKDGENEVIADLKNTKDNIEVAKTIQLVWCLVWYICCFIKSDFEKKKN